MTVFEQRMAGFRARFLTRAADDARRIEQALGGNDRAAIRDVCHGLSGNAGMFGFADVGLLAQAVEEAVDKGAGEAQVRALAADLLDRLKTLDHER